MITTRVNRDYTVNIPGKFRSGLRVGQEVAISQDAQGRLILTPIEKVRAILDKTFGMWADHDYIPHSGIEYVDQIRRGLRLDEMGLRRHQTD